LFVAFAVAFIFGLFWWFNRNAKKWLEENGREEEWPNALDWLLGDTQRCCDHDKHRLAYGGR
jgi:hypothetical protein